MTRTHRCLRLAAPVILASALVSVACVRFNTYYNARRAFRGAEELRAQRAPGSSPSSQELAYLEQCLEKCAVILARHPGSGLADDALFLMARALALKEQHNAAAEKYAELRRFFPSTEYAAASMYHEAQARAKLGQFEVAESVIEEHLGAAGSWSQWHERAALLYAEIGESRGSCADALARLDTLLSRSHRRDILSVAHLLRGRCLAAGGDDDQAFRWFQEGDRVAPNRNLRFQARLLMGEALARMGRGEEALEAFGRLRQIARADSELALVGLAVGSSQRALGDFSAAEDAWRDVIQAYPREDVSKRARMALATMLEKDLRDFTRALAEYEDLSKQGTPRLLVEDAGRRAKALRDVERLRAAVADSDGVAASALMELAELFLLRLQLPDSALPLLLLASAEHADSVWAPRALYAAATVYNSRGDSAEADSLHRELVGRYSHSRQARSVRALWGEIPPESGTLSTPEWTYLLAERAWLQEADPQSARTLFQTVVDSFPSSAQAPKALLSLAWIASETFGDTATARATLQTALERYPDTEPAQWASLAFGMGATPYGRAIDVLPHVVRIDTITCHEIAPVDSLLKLGAVMVKVLVDTSGNAREVELLKGTGSLLCDDAALVAARTADYVSAQKGADRVEAWLEVSVPFMPAHRDTSA
ncbi:TonB family protein [Candidatus Fermentibacteria bacterium]|nr:TonB family protein [Candidatus Fermentibacteria bacterium]